MKLSVCIPVYNFDVRALVSDLKQQLCALETDAEIVLIDDASGQEFLELNQEVNLLAYRVILLKKNVGRSAIRNLFLEYANGDFMLFLDCDGKIIRTNFIKRYLDFLKACPDADVIYGGRTVQEDPPGDQHKLRWNYARKRENMPSGLRNRNPYLTFQTNNFLIRRSVLERVKFNPRFSQYGYEDLLFAMDLRNSGVGISHIDNPIYNLHLETNAMYLNKAEESVANLSEMIKSPEILAKISPIRIAGAYQTLDSAGLLPVYRFIFGHFRKAIRLQLLKGTSILQLLDIYKLGLLAEKLKS